MISSLRQLNTNDVYSYVFSQNTVCWGFIYKVAPPKYKWVQNPLTIHISPINYVYIYIFNYIYIYLTIYIYITIYTYNYIYIYILEL